MEQQTGAEFLNQQDWPLAEVVIESMFYVPGEILTQKILIKVPTYLKGLREAEDGPVIMIIVNNEIWKMLH